MTEGVPAAKVPTRRTLYIETGTWALALFMLAWSVSGIGSYISGRYNLAYSNYLTLITAQACLGLLLFIALPLVILSRLIFRWKKDPGRYRLWRFGMIAILAIAILCLSGPWRVLPPRGPDPFLKGFRDYIIEQQPDFAAIRTWGTSVPAGTTYGWPEISQNSANSAATSLSPRQVSIEPEGVVILQWFLQVGGAWGIWIGPEGAQPPPQNDYESVLPVASGVYVWVINSAKIP